jgi:PAS domain S-box-containing protein
MITPAETIRVLHVDDEPGFAELTARFLERADERFVVETATGAAEGLDHLSEGDFDCVVSDYDMPGRDGIEFLEAVRERDEELPFILYTRKGSEEIASEAISAGVTDYLQKENGTSQYAVLANRVGNAVEQYRSKQEVEASRKRLSLFFDQSPLGVVEWNEDFEFVRVNETAEEILGYSEDELFGESWEAIVPDSDRPPVSEIVTGLLEDQGGYHSVNENVRGDGERIVCEWHNRVVTDENGETVAIYSQFRDITERKERESELRRKERRYQAVFNDPNILVGLIDTDGSVLEVNRTAMGYIDATTEDVIGEPFWEMPWFDHAEAARTDVKEWIDRAASGEYVEFEADRVDANGETYTVDGVVRPVTDGDGEIVSLLISSRDVTEQKERERRLEALNRATRELLAAESERSVAGTGVRVAQDILGLDANAVHLYDEEQGGLKPVAVTDATRELVGEPPTFTGGDSIAWRAYEQGEALAVDDIQEDPDRYNPETTVRSELYLPIADHGILIAGSTTPAAFDEGDVLLGEILAGNIAAALEHVGRTERLEQQTEELAGLTAELEEQYRTLFEEAPIMAVVTRTEEGRPIIEDCNEQFLETLGYETGTVVGRELAAFYGPESTAELLDRGGYERSLEGEFTKERRQLVGADGERIEALLRAVPRRDADGEVVGTLAMYVDITEREEVKRANERLEAFTGIVSHDLRNPLSVAEGRLELAQEDCESEHLDAVERAHERMDTLIEELLALAREGEAVTEVEPVDLAGIAEGCWTNVETADGSLVVETDRTIRADPSRLKQLFENLVHNAVEHGGDDATVRVGDLEGGFYVEDDGPGIPEADREAVFEAGHTTSAEGTGFGLSIVAEIVEAHDWGIRITEGSEGGARFEITGVGTVEE